MIRHVAVTYHRVSTVDQDATIAREELRRAAAARGCELLEEVEETGSGARNDRPGLVHVMDLARAGKVTDVLVWKLDRFGRSCLDVLCNVEQLGQYGATFSATSQGIAIGPEAGALSRMQLTMLGAVAEFERNLISERTRMGMAHAKTYGTKTGRPIGRPRKAMVR